MDLLFAVTPVIKTLLTFGLIGGILQLVMMCNLKDANNIFRTTATALLVIVINFTTMYYLSGFPATKVAYEMPVCILGTGVFLITFFTGYVKIWKLHVSNQSKSRDDEQLNQA